jgi:hypothetical protein
MTTEDKRAEIDRRFDETFSVFDERMRKEQETISQERAGRAGAGSGSAGEGDGEGDAKAAGGAGPGGDAATGENGEGDAGQNGGGKSGDGSGATSGDGSAGESSTGGGTQGGVGGGVRGGSGPGEVPAGIPDGSDDDIVARQLREAAMKETDPELRERLWDEYRKYKQGTQ